MRRRLAVLSTLALAIMGTCAPPTAADSLPTLSVATASWDEPIYPVKSVDVSFTVTLSAPASTDVTVQYEVPTFDVGCCPNYDAVPTQGTLTIPAGQTSAAVPVTILDDGLGPDGTIHLYLWNPSGATLASSSHLFFYDNSGNAVSTDVEVAPGTIINHDRLSDFWCAGTGVYSRLYTYRPTLQRPYWGPTSSEQDSELFGMPCLTQTKGAGATSQTVPATATTPEITVSAGPEVLTNDGNPPADPADHRPTLGMYADASASMSSVTIAVGAVSVVVQGLRAHVHSSCDALGGAPTDTSDGTVGSVIVNGIPLPVVPTSLDLGTVHLLFNQSSDTPAFQQRIALEVIEGNVDPYAYPSSIDQGLDLTFATAAIGRWGGSPCMS